MTKAGRLAPRIAPRTNVRAASIVAWLCALLPMMLGNTGPFLPAPCNVFTEQFFHTL
jgi:hypothetical protein